MGAKNDPSQDGVLIEQVRQRPVLETGYTVLDEAK